MSRWIESFESHAYRPAWNELVDKINNLQLDDETNASVVHELARLKKVVRYVSELLGSLDPELLPLSVWDNFNQQIAHCSGQVDAFADNRNEGHLNKANNYADNFLSYIRPFVVSPSKAGKAIQSALKDSARVFNDFGNGFKLKADEILESIASIQTESESVLSEIKDFKSRVDDIESEVFGDDDSVGLKQAIEDFHAKVQQMYESISRFHDELLLGDSEDDSIERQVDELLQEIKEKSNEIASMLNNTQSDLEDFDSYYVRVFGKLTKDDETGEDKRLGGLKSEIDARLNVLQKIEEDNLRRYKSLNEEIESLLPGATSAGLATAYKEMKDSFTDQISNYTIMFYGAIAGLVLLAFLTSLQSIGEWPLVFIQVDTWESVFPRVMNKLPLFIPVIWLAYFCSKRRSELQRLQQEYAHKEALAKSYQSYKLQLEDLDTEDADMRKSFILKTIDAITFNASTTLDKKHESDNPSTSFLEKVFERFSKK